VNQSQIKAATKSMVGWLSDPQELGKAPAKIELAGEFDLHDMHYYMFKMFKYKKSLFGKWLLGVCGGYESDSLEHCGHVFSEMSEYKEKTALQSGANMAEKIKAHWMEQAREFSNSPTDKVNCPPYFYSESELDEYEAYIQNTFGIYQNVFHEIASPDIHLDVIIVPPTDKDDYYKLITMGAGAYPMNVPEELDEFDLQHAEYVIFLPKDWNIQSKAPNDYWTIGMLKMIARYPISENTWLGNGHTLHGNAEQTPFSDNTLLNSILLLNARDGDGNPSEVTLNSGKRIHFYLLMCLYQEELDYKLKTGISELFNQLPDEAFPLVMHPNRPNYCK
jgi:hypothetical protein